MAEFGYTAYSPQGALVSGQLEAASEAAVFATLREQRLIPVEISSGQVSFGRGAMSRGEGQPAAPSVRNPQFLARFTRMMASLLGSHIPLIDAVSITLENEKNAKAKHVLEAIHAAILNGASLSDALGKAEGFAPSYYRSMVIAGEKSGSLGLVLGDLAEQIEHDMAITSRIRAGLLYPAILFATSLVVLIVIATVLVPAIAPLFENSGGDVPFVIATVTDLKAAFIENWMAILTSATVVCLAAIRARRLPSVQQALERLSFTMPLIGSLKANVEVAQFTKVLGIMLKNGVSLVHALEATRGVLKSSSLQQVITTAIAELREGGTLTGSIAAARHIPMLAKRLIRIGEETGTLPDMLQHVARALEEEVNRQIALMFQLVPPVMTLLIGLGVGSFILVIMDAVLSVNDLAF